MSAGHTIEAEIRGLELLREALAGELGAAFEQVAAAISEAVSGGRGRVIVTGVGKSGHVARKLAATLTATGTPAHFLHPAEASHGDLGMVTPTDVVLALSWSGEASELADVVAYTRRFGVKLVASTSCATSTLARAADLVLVLPECVEACAESAAPTTSTTMQMALGDALAVALLERSGVDRSSLTEFHPGGRLGARLKRVRDLMHDREQVPLVTESATLSEAIVRMTQGRFGMTGVVDADGALVGVVTDGDLRRAFAGGFTDRAVTAVMSRSPRTVGTDELAQAALGRMNAASITALLVVEQGRPVGVLHIHDLLRAGLV